jgi:hypothetical protein
VSRRLTPLLLLALAPGGVRADEAVLKDGRAVEGKLALDAEKRWRFVPDGKAGPLDPGAVQHVRFSPAPLPPLRAGRVWRVTLRDGQSLTGDRLDLGDRGLRLRTAWSERVAVPRGAVAAVAPWPGHALVFFDDFEKDFGAWQVKGKPGVDGPATSGKHGASLAAAGQALERSLDNPVEEGHFGVNFTDEEASGGSWRTEAEFRTPGGKRVVTVEVAGPGRHYRVEVPGLKGTAAEVERGPGYRRLTVQFSPTSLRVAVDGTALWYNLDAGPGGPLVRLRLACDKPAEAPPVRGRVVFDAGSLHRADDPPRRPPGDGKLDEVWLLSGDQLFGRAVQADDQAVVFQAARRRHRLPWSEVRELKAREGPPPERPGGRARVWIDNGVDSVPDVLDGVPLSLDARHLKLDVPDVGAVALERGRLLRVSWAAKE